MSIFFGWTVECLKLSRQLHRLQSVTLNVSTQLKLIGLFKHDVS